MDFDRPQVFCAGTVDGQAILHQLVAIGNIVQQWKLPGIAMGCLASTDWGFRISQPSAVGVAQ